MKICAYERCALCPRCCGIDRNAGTCGFCRESAALRLASACLHFGEEPPLTVFGGSGTIFVTGCNLRCAYCQNYQISQHGMGRAVSTADFAEICLRLQDAGAENINIVTGSHAIPSLAGGIRAAKTRGLSIPVCWNSSAYEQVEALELLDGLIDIWLPDLKTLDRQMSAAVFDAGDYPDTAKDAIRYMMRCAPLRFAAVSRKDSDRDSVAPESESRDKLMGGVVIRHLFLPGRMDDTIRVLDWLKKYADGKAVISLMSQYTPVAFPPESGTNGDAPRKNALSAFENRLVNPDEFAMLKDLIAAYQFEHIVYQELEQSTEWLPNFNCVQPFSASLAKPLWHWTNSAK